MQTKDKTKGEHKVLLKNVTLKKSLSGESKINLLSEEISQPRGIRFSTAR